MKPTLWLTTSLITLLCTGLGAQNTYHQIGEIDPAGGWAILGSSAAVAAGSPVLLYQAAGAEAFTGGGRVGQLQTLNGAGRYAVNRVSATRGDTIFLALPVPLGFVAAHTQLVVGLTEVPANGLTADPWNGSTGGVAFVATSAPLTIDGRISANGSGFRGGAGTEAASDCDRLTRADNLTYAADNWRGSSRGEGIASLPTGQEFGRAPSTSGGGGGNDHNAGGGGGANVADGGIGAENTAGGVFNFSCRGRFPGLGANGLPNQPEHAYFGGGGGAGHANNTASASGGNGGGLIVVWTEGKLSFGPESRLEVSGAEGSTVEGDGAGGGGAAGTIVLMADSIVGQPNIVATGGNGGDVDNPSDRCFGPGGGGGGGRLLLRGDTTDFIPMISLDGGRPGLRLNSDECAPTDRPGGIGQPGQVDTFELRLPVSDFTIAGSAVCNDATLVITDRSREADSVIWTILPSIEGVIQNPTTTGIELSFPAGLKGDFQITQDLVADGLRYPGDTLSFSVLPLPTAGDVVSELAADSLTLSVTDPQNFSEIRYDFGDGTVIIGDASQAGYRYPAPGVYAPTITLLGDTCGNLMFSLDSVRVGALTQARIREKDLSGCAPYSVSPFDASSGPYTSRRWDFPGGEPTTSTEELPLVTYAEPGNYSATLTLLGGFGADTVTTIAFTVLPPPRADFEFEAVDRRVIFRNTSDTATAFIWDFGDGSGSEAVEPSHTYAIGDTTYLVTLVAFEGPCRDTLEREVTVGDPSSIQDLARLGIEVYPNPAHDRLHLKGPASFRSVYDVSGRELRVGLRSKELDLSSIPPGLYIVRIITREGTILPVRILRRR